MRIFVRDAGQGEAPTFVVNDKTVDEYFPRYGDVLTLTGPLEAAGLAGRVDVTVLVQGGGITGQTSAVRLGWRVRWSSTTRTCACRCALVTT